jgi:alcohol dehydrogenase
MKAVVLEAFGTPLVVKNVPEPKLGSGEVIVDVAASGVLNYSHEVFSGQRQYMLALPAIPGPSSIGRVRAVGPDSTRLAPGDWVFCDPTVRSRDGGDAPDITLQGLSARGPGGLKLQQYFRDGAWAERVRVPTENAIPIGEIDSAAAPAWCALGTFLVPYGGFFAANLRAGETVLVNGATGGFGAGAVAVALALGAGCVIATGRNETTLENLKRRFGPRVRTLTMRGDEEADRIAMHDAAPGPIDCVFDILPPMASAVQVRAAVMAVRTNGRVVLMGGVTMNGGAGLELPYAWIMRNGITIHGVWMYPPDAPATVIKIVRSGQLSLDNFEIASFDLDHANEAVAHAAKRAGPFQRTVLRP